MNRILILLASLLFVGESFAFPPCPTSGYRDNCFGTHTWADGNEYVGEFKDNQFHGQGTLTLLDGSKFDGEWKGGKPYGQGTFTFADGREYAAEYKDGEFKLFRMKRGNVYEDQITMEHMGGTYIGEVSDGVPHGHGTLTFADGTKYVGEFRGQKFWYGAKYDNSGRLIATYSAGVEEENVDLGHLQWVSKPCRCLFHITPAIPNRHFIPSSLLFFIHNSQLALNGGCFQAELPPNGHRTPRLGSNNGSGDIRDGMVAKRNLAALGPLLLSGRC